MGVKGLHYFVENHCIVIKDRVSIKKLAEDHYKVCGERPTIVVDGMSLIGKIYKKNKLNWICGGQWRQYVAAVQNFVRSFSAVGIDLVVFCDGSVCGAKRKEWTKRRLQKMEEIKQLFATMKVDGKVPDVKHFQLPTAMGTLTRFVFKLACEIQVYTSTREADLEIAEYAMKNDRVFGILAQDTDYLIFNTKPYLSADHLDLENMTTVLYNRDMMCTRLGLTLSQLPLMSCLLGNDVIAFDLLKPFHRRLYSNYESRGKPAAPVVSQFIRINGWRGNADDSDEIYSICSEVFGHYDNVGLLKEGLAWYSLTLNLDVPPRSRFHGIVKRNHEMTLNPPFVYGVIHNMDYDSSELMADPTDHSLPPPALVYRSIRQRLYAVLLGNCNSDLERTPVKEWCAYSGNPLIYPELVTAQPISIPGGVPHVEDLWSDGVGVTQTRLHCFLACLNTPLRESDLADVPSRYIIFCFILNHIQNRSTPLLAMWELCAFILQAISPHANDLNYLDNIEVSWVETRAVHLAALFMRGVATMVSALGVCGYPFPIESSMPWNFFDGKLFHHMYSELKKGSGVFKLCECRENVMQLFRSLYSIATFGTAMEGRTVHFG